MLSFSECGDRNGYPNLHIHPKDRGGDELEGRRFRGLVAHTHQVKHAHCPCLCRIERVREKERDKR